MQRPEAQALLRRVEMITTAPAGNTAAGASEVTLRTRDGREFVRVVAEPRGSGADPLSWDELAEKFRDCAAVALPPAAAAEALSQIARFDALPDVRGLLANLAAPVAARA